MRVRIVDVGIATSVQDHGRPGLAHLGVPRSGVVDPGLAGLVNRLVGNDGASPLFETCGGLTIEAQHHVLVATSAELAPRSLTPGQRITVPGGSAGRLWHYLAIRGGVAGTPLLGSLSTDTLSSIRPVDAVAGSVVEIGPEPASRLVTDAAPLAALGDVARLVPGPRADWFDADWAAAFCRTPWTVTTSSRVGVRLSGISITRVVGAELPSEGLIRGAVQMPPGGDAVMMLADHPTTGGYPVIAVVHSDDVAVVAQHPAGARVGFTMYR
ncbi:MAG: biotin-dependent carboxyltransferase family protein [Ilumatobacteraceae bacterium]